MLAADRDSTPPGLMIPMPVGGQLGIFFTANAGTCGQRLYIYMRISFSRDRMDGGYIYVCRTGVSS
jgi:hypothetical protein